jgi:hypothetical protein
VFFVLKISNCRKSELPEDLADLKALIDSVLLYSPPQDVSSFKYVEVLAGTREHPLGALFMVWR